MKIRSGFVSNSSSSSFIIAIQCTVRPVQALYKALQIDPDSPGGQLFKPLVEFMAHGVSYTAKDFLDDCGYDSMDELEEKGSRWEHEEAKVFQLEKEGWRLFRVTAHSDECDDAAQQFFYANVPELDTPTVKILGR